MGCKNREQLEKHLPGWFCKPCANNLNYKSGNFLLCQFTAVGLSHSVSFLIIEEFMSTVQPESGNSAGVSVSRQFWSYVLPTLGAMLVSGLYQIVDGMFIGRFVGADGLAGINVSWPIIGGLYGVGMMIGVGSGAISSLSRGEEKYDRAKQSAGNAFGMLLLFGLLGSSLLYLFGDFALNLQNADGSTLAHAQDYLQVVTYGVIFAMGSMALPFMVRNDQSPRFATMLIVCGAVANVILNGIFIGLLGWELTGAALGTTLSQVLVVAMGLMYFFSNKAKTTLNLSSLKPSLVLTAKTCTIGLSSMLMYLYFSFIHAVHNYLFMEYGNATIVGAFAIVGYIATLYYMFAEGVASGAQPLISYNFGAKKYGLMKQFTSMMLWVAVGSGVVSVAFVNIFADYIILIFNTDDAALFEATKTGIRLHLAGMFLDGLIFSVGVFFQSLGSGRKATFVTMTNMVVQLPFLIVLPKLIGINGIWLSVPLSNVVLSVIVMGMLWFEWKKIMAPLSEQNPVTSECKAH